MRSPKLCERALGDAPVNLSSTDLKTHGLKSKEKRTPGYAFTDRQMHTPHPPPLSRLYRKKQARYIGDAVIARLQTRNGTHKTTLGLQQTPAAAVSTGCYRSSSGSVWPRITTTLTILRRFHMYSRKEKHAPFMAGICPSLLRKKLRLTASLLKQFWEAAKLDPTPFAKGSFLLDIGDHRPKGVATVATTGRILRTLGRLEHVLLTQAALQKVTLSEALQLRTRREAAQGFRKFTPAKPRKAAAQAEKTPRGANSEHSFLFCSPFPRGCTKGRAPPRCESSAKARGGDSASCRQEHCTSTPPPPPLQKRSSNRPPPGPLFAVLHAADTIQAKCQLVVLCEAFRAARGPRLDLPRASGFSVEGAGRLQHAATAGPGGRKGSGSCLRRRYVIFCSDTQAHHQVGDEGVLQDMGQRLVEQPSYTKDDRSEGDSR